ncbi:unnamed protein product [Amoebophrya sp. A25]|nr:unnamed protein product [Amoebophrya sp. A25]|eukprot:GSA25T00000467001.1
MSDPDASNATNATNVTNATNATTAANITVQVATPAPIVERVVIVYRESDGGLDPVIVVLITLGAILVAAATGYLIYWICNRKRHPEKETEEENWEDIYGTSAGNEEVDDWNAEPEQPAWMPSKGSRWHPQHISGALPFGGKEAPTNGGKRRGKDPPPGGRIKGNTMQKGGKMKSRAAPLGASSKSGNMKKLGSSGSNSALFSREKGKIKQGKGINSPREQAKKGSIQPGKAGGSSDQGFVTRAYSAKGMHNKLLAAGGF